MSNTMDDDAQQRFTLGLVFILIALVVNVTASLLTQRRESRSERMLS